MSVFPTLHLSSPHKRGGKVSHAQHILQGNNRYQQRFYKGPIDGNFGEHTAGAVRRAKHYLGYPKRKQTSTFGHQLYGYLIDDKSDPQYEKLPFRYRLRKNLRAKKAARWQPHIVKYARQFVGYHEDPPGSNLNKFGAWYGANGVPWCAEFVSYCLQHVQNGPKWFKYAFVPYVVRDARAGKNGMSITNDPTEGCLVCYDWNDDGEADHIGIFDQWENAGSTFYAIEGNTGPADRSNGGEVLRELRSRSDVQAFVSVP